MNSKSIYRAFAFSLLGLLSASVFISCNRSEGHADPKKTENTIATTPKRKRAKFEPTSEGVLVFAGQDLGSIGGLPNFTEGYCNHFPIPAGVTLYTGIGPNDGSFGGENDKGLLGIYETTNHGDGPTNMMELLKGENFQKCALAIGFSLVNNEENVVSGKLDENIKKLGEFFLSLGKRPVFLRIGYEFDGDAWNHYNREAYVKAYQRIKDQLDEQGITNVAYVWQSVGWVSNQEQLEAWYPGDEYVDWCAFSFFSRFKEVEMIDFARKKGKPVFIAEASPTISDFKVKFTGETKETVLSNPVQAQEAWDKWFIPFFKTIEDNKDIIKAISYINCNWRSHEMWFENPTFQKIDARLQTSEMISKGWMSKMNQTYYINASHDLYQQMGIQE